MSDDKPRRPSRQEVPRGLAKVSNIIAIASGKGGVGKSTVSTNFAMALLRTGAKVGLLDADIYGPSQPAMLGAVGKKPEMRGDYLIPMERHGLRFMSLGLLMTDDQPVIWRGPMASKMIQQFLGNVLWDDLDYLIIDLPPGSGDVQITLAQQAQLTGAVIVTTPQQVALGVAKKGLQMFETVNVPIVGVIENMSGFTCPKCGENTPIFKSGGGEKLAADFKVDFLGRIPLDPELMACGDDGIPLLVKTTESPSAKAFIHLASTFKEKVAKGALLGKNEARNMEMANGNLELEWPDGTKNEFTPYNLRINCGCALCMSEDTGQRIIDPKQVPLDIKIGAFERVGRYAVTMSFSDGHNTGIYKFEMLRELAQKQIDSSRESFSV